VSGQHTPGPASAAGPEPVMHVTPEAATALQQFALWLGLDAVRVDLSGCADKAEFLARVADALGFPTWFGGNWDAFFDCLIDLARARRARGCVIVLRHAGELQATSPEAFDTARSILADAAKVWSDRGVALRVFVETGTAA